MLRRRGPGGLLQDGLATVWLARYLNAARLAPGWASPHVLVEIRTTEGAVLHPQENNAVWFSSGYRAGRAKLNFLITHGLSDEALRAWRDRMGPPDRTITCPEDHDLGIDGKAAFEVWIWDRDDAQARLAEIVTHHNLRGAFAPVVGASALPIDVAWGMTTAPGDGALVGRRRVWRRGDHRDQATLATSYEVYAPGGRYRVDVELDAVPRAAASGPVAELVVETDRAPDQRFAIAAGTHRATFEVVIRNPGAATSGNATRLSVAMRDADSLDLSGVTLTPLALDSIAPFEIFR